MWWAASPIGAEELTAEMLRHVLHLVAEREEEPAGWVGVAHPASWDAACRKLLSRALHEAGHAGVVLVPEPVAAAAHLAARGRLEPGRTVAIFDVGAGSFDAAVVRGDGPDTFTLLGEPLALTSPCGADLEEALFTRVLADHEDRVGALDTDDPEVLAAMGRLLAGCVVAKEALSHATAVTIPVLLPGLRSEARFTRDAFEAMIRSPLQAAVEALGMVVTDSEHVQPADVDHVLLIGGCARIPLVAELLSAQLQRPVTAHPGATTAVVLGTALAASRAMKLITEVAALPTALASPQAEPEAPPPGLPSPRSIRIRRATAAAAGLAAVAAAVAVPLALLTDTRSLDTEAQAKFRAAAPPAAPLMPAPAPGTTPPLPAGEAIPTPTNSRPVLATPRTFGVASP